MINKTNLYKQFYKALPALVIIFTLYTTTMPGVSFARTLPISNAKTSRQDDFDKKFREGRDLIDKGDWAKAAEKFNEVIGKYPDNKSTDAALYWLAFCYKKQKQFEEMGATLDRLLKDFPSSSWSDDARVMKIEVAYPLGKVFVTGTGQQTASTSLSGTYSTNIPRKPGQPPAIASSPKLFESYAVLGETYAANSKTPLDREDEIKIAAFQSLLSADFKKGIAAMSEILKPDSKAGELLKLEVLRVLRRPRLVENYTPLQAAQRLNTLPSVRSEFTASLKEPLVRIFQNEPNIKIRTEIIYTLASLKDEQSTNYLAQLYASENNQEVKKAIINGLGSSWGTLNGLFSARPSINRSGQNSAVAVNGNTSTQTLEFIKLMEIMRTEKDVELRRLALSHLQRFAGWDTNGQSVELLSSIYDSETDENLKRSIIQSLARISQPQSSKKLLEIAKTDKSDKLKLEAIYALGKSNDPEALKYLEEILK